MPDDLKSKASIMVREFIILCVKVHNFTIEVKERRYIGPQIVPNPSYVTKCFSTICFYSHHQVVYIIICTNIVY